MHCSDQRKRTVLIQLFPLCSNHIVVYVVCTEKAFIESIDYSGLTMKGRKLQSRHSKKSSSNNSPDLREVVSRKEVCAATINMSGRSGLGLTPKYKIDMVKEYLQCSNPDVIILQDCIDQNDMVAVLEDISHGSLEWHFRPDNQSNETDEGEEEQMGSGLLTGIVWKKDKYLGTPLKMDDQRLTQYRYVF